MMRKYDCGIFIDLKKTFDTAKPFNTIKKT